MLDPKILDEISKKIKVAREGSLLYVEWLITSLCQCRCIYCRHEKYKLGANLELSTKEALNVIKQMADMGVVYVTLSGGEPLIRKDIFKIINELYQHDIEIRLDTNGLLLDKKTITQLARFRDLLTLSISLDSSIPEINETIRVCSPGSTQKIMKSIGEAKATDIIVNISTILTKKNANIINITELYNFLSKNSVDTWTISFVRPFGRAREIWSEIGVLPTDTPEVSLNIIKLMKESTRPTIQFLLNSKELATFLRLNHSRLLSSPTDISSLKICEHCTKGAFLHITPWGDVLPCLNLPENMVRVGNLRISSLRELWERSKSENLIHNKKIVDLLEDCKSCRYLNVCRGGCRAQALQFNGSLTKCDPITRNKLEFLFTHVKNVPLKK